MRGLPFVLTLDLREWIGFSYLSMVTFTSTSNVELKSSRFLCLPHTRLEKIERTSIFKHDYLHFHKVELKSSHFLVNFLCPPRTRLEEVERISIFKHNHTSTSVSKVELKSSFTLCTDEWAIEIFLEISKFLIGPQAYIFQQDFPLRVDDSLKNNVIKLHTETNRTVL
jgi:hypothetical protein